MTHLVLLGDSIFDNAVYSAPEPDVSGHLRTLGGASVAVTLLAIDGSITTDVEAQLARIPSGATHLVLSSGGNDALGLAGMLEQPVPSVGAGFFLFRDPLVVFAGDYGAIVADLRSRGLPTAVCTIYNGNLPGPQGDAAAMGVALFDDVIQRVAIREQVDVIELRDICTGPSDYANPIEPSGPGGRKIAQAILRWAEGATVSP